MKYIILSMAMLFYGSVYTCDLSDIEHIKSMLAQHTQTKVNEFKNVLSIFNTRYQYMVGTFDKGTFQASTPALARNQFDFLLKPYASGVRAYAPDLAHMLETNTCLHYLIKHTKNTDNLMKILGLYV
jgi:hypothetical protein